MSTKMKTWIKDVVDFAIKENNLASFTALSRMKLSSIERIQFLDGIFKTINGAIGGITTTVGSGLDNFFKDPVDFTLGNAVRGFGDAADWVGSTAGPFVMGALGAGADWVGGLGNVVGAGVGGLVDKPLASVSGFLGDLAGKLLPVIIIVIVVIIIVFLAYYTLRGVIASQISKRL
jgi:hypothetical protein